jgi:hypothetical protein
MDKTLFTAIFNKNGIKLILYMPTSSKKAIDIQELAKKSHVAKGTAYRLMNILSKWDNIGKVIGSKFYENNPSTYYYIKKRRFSITIDNNKVILSINNQQCEDLTKV